ncbi:hypothetical protein A3F29_04065 [Candidatus Roizmanbacteria bacterium RIFCSPHIGHO2_12_FULL_33_9]|uniref:Aminotransferase class III n=1 Tax=Candidatus Roizmanbacteria bacterium RIFCSPHIGHO2_12_FULL_33_9 TaxID=1802045 RepID=A0A1F7HK61_9BACT|nr:MAG: hypothetical protein A3F29_04065 [Candidatus Roizmanbacteria bacterium RIFCSPHIGHO2_12_FULL_33_9]
MGLKYVFLTKNVTPTTKISVKKAKGVRLWDTNNKEYLDFSSQTLNLNLGNSPKIAKRAFLTQFNRYSFSSTRFISKSFIELSKKLVSISPKGLTKVNIKLTNGSDANESAIKRARIFRKKPYIVTFFSSHLGETSETLNASKKLTELFYGGSSYFIQIPSPFEKNNSEEKTLNKIETLFLRRKDIAAIIIEPIVVNSGVHIFSKKFLRELRQLCNKYNVSLIFDEIQTAFGWLGSIFASEYFGVTPDMLTIGKGFAAGFPLAGILMKKEYDVLDYGLDEYTYGGHAISCAIAQENINFLTKTKILNTVKKNSLLFSNLLTNYKISNKDKVKEVRFCGLIAGIEFRSTLLTKKLFTKLIKNGLITRKSSNNPRSIVLKPPIIVSPSILKKAVDILDKTTTNI